MPATTLSLRRPPALERALERAAEGEEQAFLEVVQATSAELYRYAGRLVADPELAARITAEAFARTLAAVRGRFYDARMGIHLFLYQGVTRLGLDALTGALEQPPVRAEEERAPSTPRVPTAQAALAELASLLGPMPAQDRAAWVLRAVEGFTLPEAAAILGEPASDTDAAAVRVQAALESALGTTTLKAKLEGWQRVTAALVPSAELRATFIERLRPQEAGQAQQGRGPEEPADPMGQAFRAAVGELPVLPPPLAPTSTRRPGWYLKLGAEAEGPFTSEEVHEKLARDQVLPGTLAWREGLERFTALAGLSEFAKTAPPKPGAASLLPSIPEPEPEPEVAPVQTARSGAPEVARARPGRAAPHPSFRDRTTPPVFEVAQPLAALGQGRARMGRLKALRLGLQAGTTALAVLDLVLVLVLWAQVHRRPPAPVALSHPEFFAVAPPVRLSGVEPTFAPALSNEEIMKVARAHVEPLLACAEEQERRRPNLHGTLGMRWSIRPDGSVGAVRAVTPAFAGTYLASCIRREVAGWQFPPHRPPGQGVTFPFRF